MSEYLSTDQFGYYVDMSQKEHKIVVVTDCCGSGKSFVRNKYVAKNLLKAPRIVVEKISTCDRIKKDLISLGVKENIIGVYHSGKESEADLKELYTFGTTKPISIITHERLSLDPLVNWLSTRYNFTPFSTLIIIDEVINNMTNVVTITEGSLLGTAKVSFNSIYQPLKDAIEHHRIFSMAEAIQLITNNYVDLDQYSGEIIKLRIGLANVGIIASKSNSNIQKLESQYLMRSRKKFTPFQSKVMTTRITYQLALVCLSILTGRYKLSSTSNMLKCAIISPLYSWNAINGVATLVLDATGKYNFYPDDLCFVAEPFIPGRKDLMSIHKISGINHDKRTYLYDNAEELEENYDKIYYKLRELIKNIHNEGDKLYICTWKDSDDKLRLNVEKMIYDICKGLHFYTDQDAEKELDSCIFPKDDIGYAEFSNKLDLKIQVSISHFGKSRGENKYSNCNKVLIIGDYYLPQEVYNRYESLLQREIHENEIRRSVFATTLQEIQRSRERKGLTVDIYMISSDPIIRLIQSIIKLKHYENYPAIKDVTNYPMYKELKNLNRSQKTKLVDLQDNYPGLLESKLIEIPIRELSSLWNTREDHIKRDLERMMLEAPGLSFEISQDNIVGIFVEKR